MLVDQQLVSPEDEDRYFQVMTEYNDLMRSLDSGPAPMCHFTPMEFLECDSDPSGRSDGYSCRHCGHSKDSTEAWAQVRARSARSPSLDRANTQHGPDEELF